MLVLASTQKRLVELERLQEARRQKEFGEAMRPLGSEQQLVVSIFVFLGHDKGQDGPGPEVGWPAFMRWLRAGMAPDLLPAALRPDLERAQDLGRQLTTGEMTPDLAEELGGWASWLLEGRDEADRWVYCVKEK